MKKTITLTFIMMLFITINTIAGSLEDESRKVAGNLLTRKEYFLYEGGKGLHYAEVFAAAASLKTAVLLHDQSLQESIIDRYKGLLDADSRFISDRQHVDHCVQAVLPFAIYEVTKDERYKQLGLKYVDAQYKETTADGLTTQARWWADDMYMIGILQISGYRITHETKYLDRAAQMISAYLPKLQQPNGLFLHGPNAPFYWGRGNGWVAAILCEMLTDLPKSNPHYKMILEDYRRMMNALVEYQSDNGMWRQLVDYPYSWAESSSSAMFAYSMQRGINLGLLTDAKYKMATDKAFQAVLAHINKNGEIREVCVGTNKMPDRDFYLERPRVVGDFHGQAPLLWLLNEHLKAK